jgi:hypothetical protein
LRGEVENSNEKIFKTKEIIKKIGIKFDIKII